MEHESGINVMSISDEVLIVTGWEKGDEIHWICRDCENQVDFTFGIENSESFLGVKDINCSCGAHYQLIY